MINNYLAYLRIKNGLSQNEVADKLGYTIQSISQWENGKSFPSLTIWSKYASILKVDLNGFLLEKEQKEDSICEELKFNIDVFSRKLKYLRKKNNYTQSQLASILNISKKTIISYEKGLSTPNKEQFIALCNLYSISANGLYFSIDEEKTLQKADASKKKIILPILIPIVVVLTVGGGIGTTIAINNRNKKSPQFINEDSSLVESTNDPISDISDISEQTSENSSSISDISEQSSESSNSISDTSEQSSESSSEEIITPSSQYLEYGYYPQTIVDDEETINQLNSLTPLSSGYYFYDNNYYFKDIASVYPDYSVMYIVHASKFSNNEEIITGNSYYFKVEPIKWRLIKETTDNYLLYSDIVLDVTYFDDVSNNYKESHIREFLNNDFYQKAFFLDDSKIIISEVDNSINSTRDEENDYLCENTFDKVFIPSDADMEKEEFGYTGSSDEVNTSHSDYAALHRITYDKYAKASYYWLRTPSYQDSTSVRVMMGGLFGEPCNIKPGFNAGIRPLIQIKKS